MVPTAEAASRGVLAVVPDRGLLPPSPLRRKFPDGPEVVRKYKGSFDFAERFKTELFCGAQDDSFLRFELVTVGLTALPADNCNPKLLADSQCQLIG
jgi:hypothetical protein